MHISPLRIAIVALLAVGARVGAQQPPAATRELGVKWVRDSEEYAALARQVYRLAADAVDRARTGISGPWAVVLDIDETTLDNSTYQLERASYGVPFDTDSWNAWVDRREASAVPGVKAFVDRVRGANGHVAWITNRDAARAEATRANLKSIGVWADDDRLCGIKPQYPKAQRRREVVTGMGECAWPNTPTRVLAFVGDQLGDFPAAAEMIPGAGTDEAFGKTCFLLPNPMYGDWTSRVTRGR
jgi:5'-nucleotidase (lipoprotein e(P4) family)